MTPRRRFGRSSLRSPGRALAASALLLAIVAAVPAAARSGSSKKDKPVGELVRVLHEDVYVGTKPVTHGHALYARRVVRTAGTGRVRFRLKLKNTLCTLQKRTRIVVLPSPGVALRVTSPTGEVWCATGSTEGTAKFEAIKNGKKTVIATRDPVFGLVVGEKRVVVKVRRGAVVVTGSSGRKRAVVVGGAREAVVPTGGDPRQPQPLALTPTASAVAATLAQAVPAPQDTKAPSIKLLDVPGNPSDRILGRFSFSTAGKENPADITYSCSFDDGGFFVCAPPVLRPFGPGVHTFSVRAVDPAGNFGKVTTRRWRVERPPAGWIAFESNRDGNFELYAMNADGSGEARLTTSPGVDVDPAWSPDGRELVFETDRDSGRSADLYTMNVEGTTLRRLTSTAANERNPKWSPSGDRVAFESNREGNYELYVMRPDGAVVRRLTTNPDRDSEPSWSPDAASIAFESDRDGNPELYVMNADGSGQTRLTDTASAEFNPAWSPDGKKIAFDSDRSGNQDIYVMDIARGSVSRLTASAARDSDPAWSPDGTRIAFGSNRAGTTEIFAMNADGTSQTRLTRSDGESLVPSWS